MLIISRVIGGNECFGEEILCHPKRDNPFRNPFIRPDLNLNQRHGDEGRDVKLGQRWADEFEQKNDLKVVQLQTKCTVKTRKRKLYPLQNVMTSSLDHATPSPLTFFKKGQVMFPYSCQKTDILLSGGNYHSRVKSEASQ